MLINTSNRAVMQQVLIHNSTHQSSKVWFDKHIYLYSHEQIYVCAYLSTGRPKFSLKEFQLHLNSHSFECHKKTHLIKLNLETFIHLKNFLKCIIHSFCFEIRRQVPATIGDFLSSSSWIAVLAKTTLLFSPP